MRSPLLPLLLLNVTGTPNCQSGVWQWGIWTSSLSNSACYVPFLCWLSAFRLGTIAAFLSVRTPSSLSPQVTQPRVYDHRRPCKSDSIATNLTRLFFPAKNSCDQTSDLEIVKEEDAPLRPLGPPKRHNPSLRVTSFLSFLQSLPYHNNL